MRIVEQKYSLSEEDLVHLQGTDTIEKMLKQRLVCEFDSNPDIDQIDFSGARGFYLIKNLGHKMYQFWFEDIQDYDDFRANILAYKMSSSIKDDK
tara:strand:- start:60307 stop:60591 length:285 start_codon:yes stop_codon:yes gene_type:complete